MKIPISFNRVGAFSESSFPKSILNGLLFYAPLDNLSQYAATGQKLNLYNDSTNPIIGYKNANMIDPDLNYCTYINYNDISSSNKKFIQATISNIPIGSAARTMMCVVKKSTYSTGPTYNNRIIGYGQDSTLKNINFQHDYNGYLLFDFAGSKDIKSTVSLSDLKYHFLVGVVDGNGNQSFYVDNVLIGTKSYSVNTTSDVFNIGNHSGTTTNYVQFYSGLIKNVALWNRALTENQMNYLYVNLGNIEYQKSIFKQDVTKTIYAGVAQSIILPASLNIGQKQLNYIGNNLPAGLSISYYENSYTNSLKQLLQITGTPTVVGTTQGTINLTANGFSSVTQNLSFTVAEYQVTASDQSFSFYQKNQSKSIQYSCQLTPTIQIVEGSLPSSITFSNGTFTGKGLTDDDHVYTLKIRFSGTGIVTKQINVTLNTYKTARISMSAQSFSFTTEATEYGQISTTSDETVTYSIYSGTLPAGITFNTATGKFTSDGTQTAADTSTVVIKAVSEHNQTGVTASMTLNTIMNAITITTSTISFDMSGGSQTKTVSYTTSKNSITPVYSYSGTLPASITFDTATGTFTYDGSSTTEISVSVVVTVSSSTGSSTADSKTITVEAKEQSIETNCIWHIDFENGLTEQKSEQTGVNRYSLLFSIQEDTDMGKYLRGVYGYTYYVDRSVYWTRSTTYLQTYLSDYCNFSVSFWMRSPNWTSQGQNLPICFKVRDSSNGFLVFRDDANPTKLTFRVGANNVINLASNTVGTQSDWCLWTFIRDGDTAKIYFNGILDRSITGVSTANITPTICFNIGYSAEWSTGFYGDITNIRIWNRAITQTEITYLYSNKL